MGPNTLFDKSFLQSLSTDESVWFDNYFNAAITPVFLAETLGDLWKQPRAGKTSEEEVGIIAAKTPEMNGAICPFHLDMCIQDLIGNHVALTGQIPISDLRPVFRDGMEGAIAEVSDEAKALHRWREDRFLEVERDYGARWRRYVEELDLASIKTSMTQFGVNAQKCKTVQAALAFADQAIDGLTKTAGRFDSMLEALGIPQRARPNIKERWKRKGKPPLRLYAPYAAHILRVELFFHIALGANLISSTRPSNKIDIAYLYYLPFCDLFVSSDKLHRTCAPLFMRLDQEFIWGLDLKADLAALNTHFTGLPDEIKEQGLMVFAQQLPKESQGLIRQIFERRMPALLKAPTFIDPARLDPVVHKKIVEDMHKWNAASSHGVSTGGEIETTIIKRSVSGKRGSWVQVAEGSDVIDSTFLDTGEGYLSEDE